MVSDYQKAGGSYILRFYDDVANLTHYYSMYQSAVLELEARYPNYEDTNKFMENLDETVKSNFIGILQNLRHHVNTSYISYCSLIKELKAKKTKDEVKESYNLLNKSYIIEVSQSFTYVQLLNDFLLSEILKDLLETSRDLINNVYGSKDSTTD